jgi:HEAT repeats
MKLLLGTSKNSKTSISLWDKAGIRCRYLLRYLCPGGEGYFRGFLRYIAYLLIFYGEISAAGNTAGKTTTNLVVSDSKGAELQLEVRQMPLAKVLDSIAKQTKVPIHYSVLPEGVITATCVGSALKPLLECLLNRKADLIVRYPKVSDKMNHKGQIVEAWVLGSMLETTANKNAVCTATSQSGSMTLNSNQPEGESESEPDQTDEMLKIAQSKNATERADAIGSLLAIGRKGDPKVKAMLEEALHDPDANVRAQAISTLTHLGDNKESAMAAIQEGLQDDSIDVRLMAVDSITDDVGLLQQAVNDSDETIRSLAEIKLEQLMQSNKAKP